LSDLKEDALSAGLGQFLEQIKNEAAASKLDRGQADEAADEGDTRPTACVKVVVELSRNLTYVR
jgi:hypothetical protein